MLRLLIHGIFGGQLLQETCMLSRVSDANLVLRRLCLFKTGSKKKVRSTTLCCHRDIAMQETLGKRGSITHVC